MNKTFKKIINALILTAILISTSYLYSANAAQTPNTLNIDNQSGEVLYISVERDDNLWLNFTKHKWGYYTHKYYTIRYYTQRYKIYK